MNTDFFQQTQVVITSGGIIMIPLAILSFFLYRNLIALLFYLKRIRFISDTENGAGESSAVRVAAFPSPRGEAMRIHPGDFDFEELQWRLRHFVSSRLSYTRAMLVAAPLIGLLGTVMGMLTTFHGLSLQAGQETATAVADGVSRALITTQTGLMIAIPGLFLSMWIRKSLRKMEQRLLELHVTYRQTINPDIQSPC